MFFPILDARCLPSSLGEYFDTLWEDPGFVSPFIPCRGTSGR